MRANRLIESRRVDLFCGARKTFVWLLGLTLLLASLPPVASQTKPRKRAATQARKSDKWEFRPDKSIALAAANPEFKMSAFDQSIWLASPRIRQQSVRGSQPSSTNYEAFNAEFQDESSQKAFSVAGVSVFNRIGRFADFFIRSANQAQAILSNVTRAKGLVLVEWAGKVEVPPPPKLRRGPRARGEAERIVRGGLNGLTGRGVIIAIVDSGVDFRNPDFINYDAQGRPTSRLLYLWDTTSNAYESEHLGGKAPISYPNGASVGTLYSRVDLNNELRSKVIRIPATDLNGHGTACAGVAASNGNNGKGREEVKGVAPDADIIAVRIGKSESGVMESGFLMGAVANWLDYVGGKTPLVMSCSFGSHAGGHDGNLILERQLNARFSAERVGRALAISAGNEATYPIHAEVKFSGESAPGLVKFNGGVGGAVMQVYFDSGDLKDLVVAPAGNSRFIGRPSGGVNPITKQVVGVFKVEGGLGGLYLYNRSGRETTAHVYISARLREDKVLFVPDSASYRTLVAAPGTTPNAITVASYDWNNQFQIAREPATFNASCFRDAVPIDIGNISCYSSPGYSRNGHIKPDLAAPGEIYHSSYAKLLTGKGVNPGHWQGAIDFSGNYCLFTGTSAATPYAAGIVALMFQKKSNLTLGQVKKLLHENVTQNAATKAIPNQHWGHGKLDIDAVERVLGAIK